MAAQSDLPQRILLDGVPRVAFYEGQRCPEDFPFQTCLRAWLEYRGELLGCQHAAGDPSRAGCTYAYLIAASGHGSGLTWHAHQWDGANQSIAIGFPDPNTPFRRTLAAVGYTYELAGNADGSHASGDGINCLGHYEDEATLRERIVSSLVDGRPCIGFGIVGPPEACLLTGYDEQGDTLLGWSMFQQWPECTVGVEFEPSGQFRKRDWYADTSAIMTIGPGRDPAWQVPYRKILANNLEALRPASFHDRDHGLAAYAPWATDLLEDPGFQSGDLGLLRMLHMVHMDAVGSIAEGRWYTQLVLEEAATHFPEAAEPIRKAARLYREQHDLMWKVWDAGGGNGMEEVNVRALARPESRQAVAALLPQAYDLDARALEQLERATQLA